MANTPISFILVILLFYFNACQVCPWHDFTAHSHDICVLFFSTSCTGWYLLISSIHNCFQILVCSFMCSTSYAMKQAPHCLYLRIFSLKLWSLLRPELVSSLVCLIPLLFTTCRIKLLKLGYEGLLYSPAWWRLYLEMNMKTEICTSTRISAMPQGFYPVILSCAWMNVSCRKFTFFVLRLEIIVLADYVYFRVFFCLFF